MSRSALNCTLRAINGNKNIALPNNKGLYLGRSEETGITDISLSRKQILATANYKNSTVSIAVQGSNSSGCNGYVLVQGTSYTLKHDDCLELLSHKHIFRVVFEPTPEYSTEMETVHVNKKKKPNYSLFDIGKASVSTVNKGLWETINNGQLLVYTLDGIKSQKKIASFDLDGTLIKTKSGSRFAKDSKDWMLNYPDIPKILDSLYTDCFKIVIFTNQAALGMDRAKVAEFKTKIEHILSHIKVPMQVFVATTKSMYRKPLPGMWDALCKEKNTGVEVDISGSFFVGDAAGRSKNWAPKKNKDHSIADRLFAMNLNLMFFTPEEYFLKASAVPFVMPKFDPRNLANLSQPVFNCANFEVIIMVGSPASGKSHYYKNYLSQDYVHINRDSLGSWQQCIKLLEKSLKDKRSVVVDNTNPDKASRKKYIDVAKQNGVPVRCLLMTTSIEHCKHNNKFRSLTDSNHALVGDIILYSYQKHFEQPTLDEGFSEIVKMEFVPNFNDSESERLYRMFLLES